MATRIRNRVGTKSRVVTYPSGRRVRLTMVDDRVVSRTPLPRMRPTKSAKRLRNVKRRIGL